MRPPPSPSRGGLGWGWGSPARQTSIKTTLAAWKITINFDRNQKSAHTFEINFETLLYIS
jgi:hypothetical protein